MRLDDRRTTVPVWMAWVLLVSFLAFHREPWRDEAETWLMARDASFAEVLHRTAYLGTPVLWFTLLFPFAKSGLPFETQAVLPIALAYVLVVLGLFFLASRDGPPTWVDRLLLARTVFLVRFRELPRTARIVAGPGLAFVVWQVCPPRTARWSRSSSSGMSPTCRGSLPSLCFPITTACPSSSPEPRFVLGFATAVRTWRIERASSFSEGMAMASFLRERGLALDPIAAHTAPSRESVLVHLPRRTFWYPGVRDTGSCMKWAAAYALGERLGPQVAAQRVRAAFPRDQRPLLLLNEELRNAEGLGFRLLFATPGDISRHGFPNDTERFFVHEPVPGFESTDPAPSL